MALLSWQEVYNFGHAPLHEPDYVCSAAHFCGSIFCGSMQDTSSVTEGMASAAEAQIKDLSEIECVTSLRVVLARPSLMYQAQNQQPHT